MGRRNDIDWERVECDYLSGLLTLAQIAEKNACSASQIKVKAKQGGWKRDLSAAIRQATLSKISTIDVAALIEQSASEGFLEKGATIKEAIDRASNVAAGVVMRHRASFARQSERATAIEHLFDAMISGGDECDVAKAAVTFKALVDARAKLVGLERESFGIAGNEAAEERNVDDLPPGDAWRVCSNALS